MERRLHPRIVHGQILVCLERVDRLVFRSVILEHAANLLHVGDGDDVCEEENRSDHTVDGVVGEVGHRRHPVMPDEIRDAERRENEDAHADEQGQDHRPRHRRARHLLFALLILRGHTGRIVQRADAENERLDENDGTADDRELQEGILLRDGDQPVLADGHAAIGLADGDRVAGQRAHHDALEDRLTSDQHVHVPVCSGRHRGGETVRHGVERADDELRRAEPRRTDTARHAEPRRRRSISEEEILPSLLRFAQRRRQDDASRHFLALFA